MELTDLGKSEESVPLRKGQRLGGRLALRLRSEPTAHAAVVRLGVGRPEGSIPKLVNIVFRVLPQSFPREVPSPQSNGLSAANEVWGGHLPSFLRLEQSRLAHCRPPRRCWKRRRIRRCRRRSARIRSCHATRVTATPTTSRTTCARHPDEHRPAPSSSSSATGTTATKNWSV